jgi:hypothetical protein
MFAGNEKDLTETLFLKIARLCHHFLDAESDAQDRIVPRETAIAAIVDAFVRQIKRRKQPHGATEMPEGERTRRLRHRFQLRIGLRRDELLKPANNRRLAQGKIIESGRK